MIALAPRLSNPRDLFSHSVQCDDFLSTISPKVGGVEHIKCRCWCHNALDLFATSEPEYDLTPPPEYANSADAAFALDEPVHVKVGFSNDLVYEDATSLENIPALLSGNGVLSSQDQDSAAPVETLTIERTTEVVAPEPPRIIQFPARPRPEIIPASVIHIKNPQRFKLEISRAGDSETHWIATEAQAQVTARSWYSRGVRVKLTDTKTGRVIYGAGI